MRLTCPNCGERDVAEFSFGGEDRGMPSDDPQREFQRTILRANVAGPATELWHHGAGCGGWFRLVRDTLTDEVVDAGVPVRG